MKPIVHITIDTMAFVFKGCDQHTPPPHIPPHKENLKKNKPSSIRTVCWCFSKLMLVPNWKRAAGQLHNSTPGNAAQAMS